MTTRTSVRSVCVLFIVGCAVAGTFVFEHVSALSSEAATGPSARVLKRGYHFRGTPTRVICNDSFHVGDTVSITLSVAGPIGLSVPAWVSTLRGQVRRIPREPTGPLSFGIPFVLERLEGRGSAYTGRLAEVGTDVERTMAPPDGNDRECIGGPGNDALYGTLLRTLRFK